MKLTKAQILAIPELSKTMKKPEVASLYQVSVECIDKWIRKLRGAGYEIAWKRGRPAITLDHVV